ncbi:MerR family transcriptional regulator [Actibacterium sp. D379-3]
MEKSRDAFRTISEVSEWLDTPAHVLRFWESRFSQIKPVKRAGGRRYYRPADMLLLGGLKKLLHEDGVTIRGVQKILRDQGIKHVCALSQPLESGLVVDDRAEQEPEEPQADTVPEAPMHENAEAAPAPDNVVPLIPAEPPAPQAEQPPAAPAPEQPAAAPEQPPTPKAEASQPAPADAAPTPDLQPELDLGPVAVRPPLGADLPPADPVEDSIAPGPAPLTARLRHPATRRHLRQTHGPYLAAALARLTALQKRLS